MYFFDLADYLTSCFFGINSSLQGDPEDEQSTYRATRDAFLKAINQLALNAYSVGAGACTDCHMAMANSYGNIFNFLAEPSTVETISLFWNMHLNWGIDINNPTDNLGLYYPSLDKKIGVQVTTYQRFIYDPATNTSTDVQESITIDYGDGLWNQTIFDNYMEYLSKLNCLLKAFEKTVINLPQKAEITNFNQIT